MTYCVFCDEEKMKKDVIHTQKNFFAAVGLSLVTPGHVMIITRGHYACFGDLPEGLDQEYSEFEKKLGEEYIKKEKKKKKKKKKIKKKEGEYIGIKENGRLYVCHINDIENVTTNPGLNYPAFFSKRKGLDISKWQNMGEEHMRTSEEIRTLTISTLSNIL